jgi:hypothetical protein
VVGWTRRRLLLDKAESVTFDDIRKIALVWPEVEDGSSYGTPALKVRKKLLVRLKEDGDSLVISGVPPEERELLVEREPRLFYFTDHYRNYPMVLIRLSEAKRADVEPLLRRQWRTLASKAAIRDFDIGQQS